MLLSGLLLALQGLTAILFRRLNLSLAIGIQAVHALLLLPGGAIKRTCSVMPTPFRLVLPLLVTVNCPSVTLARVAHSRISETW